MSLLAQNPQLGNITNPFKTIAPGSALATVTGTQGQGLILLLNNLIKFVIVLAGLYTFWNLIAAGYGFLSAGGEAKNITKAWEKIWQSLIGLLIVAGSFILAAIFGYLIFGADKAFILIRPEIYAP